jgi:hypothetical protein
MSQAREERRALASTLHCSYAALAWYHDHREEANADIRAEREWYEKSTRRAGLVSPDPPPGQRQSWPGLPSHTLTAFNMRRRSRMRARDDGL